MKIYLILLLSLVAVAYSFAQSNYFTIIYKAEEKILEGKYNEAAVYYAEAFKLDSNIFYKDVHNGLLCSVKADNNDLEKYFIDLASEFNLDTAFYSKSVKQIILNNSLETKNTLIKSIKNNIRSPQCQYFELLLKLDQSVRNACKSISGNFYVICELEIKTLDSINLYHLKQKFLTEGILSERKICNHNPSLSPLYYLIIKHNLQWGRNDLDSFLLSQVQINKFHPQFYADLVEYYNISYLKNNKGIYGMGLNVKLGEKLFIFPVEDDTKQQINKQRAAINLDDIDIYNRKVVFQYKNPEFYLIYPGLISSLDVDETTKTHLINTWKEFEVK